MSFTLCLTFTFTTFTFDAMTKLSEAIRASGRTDEAVANAVGCSRSMLTKIKLGRAVPSLGLAVAIARETGVPVEALLPEAAERAS
jgi:transcriptional regulator with XRE-family HTH domain